MRERFIKETIYQNFLLTIADVIIIFLPQCTFSDQKLIEQILKKCPNKQIVVAHNLKTLDIIYDVENEIQELKTLFPMSEQNIEEDILKDIKNFNAKNKKMFYRQNAEKQPNVYHIILAKENTEAGDFYNEPAMEWIKTLISRKDPKLIEIQNTFREYFNDNILKYFKLQEKELTKVSFPDFGKPTLENGIKVSKSKLNHRMTPIQVVENFVGEVESTQCFKPEIIFESGDINVKPNKSISGKIKMPLPNSKAFQIFKAFFFERDGEIYVHVDGFKNSFKFEPSNSTKEEYLKDMKPISGFDHTSFGPFIIEEPLTKLAGEKNQLKSTNQMRSLVKEVEDPIGKKIGNYYEIEFTYKIINKRKQ